MVNGQKQKPPRAGWSLFGSSKTAGDYKLALFSVAWRQDVLPAVVPLELEFLFLITSVGKRPFGDIFWKKYFSLKTGIVGERLVVTVRDNFNVET